MNVPPNGHAALAGLGYVPRTCLLCGETFLRVPQEFDDLTVTRKLQSRVCHACSLRLRERVAQQGA
jgi:hypothetical protein